MTRTSRSAYRSIAVLLVLLAMLAAPMHASAVVAETDAISGVALSETPDLEASAPDMEVPSGLLMTADGVVLWDRHPQGERAMASTTKIMTAVVVLEAVDDLENIVTMTAAATRIGESVAGIQPGERHTVRELLAAMLVHSGNEAAVALAMHVGGDVDTFVDMMNAKAVDLGMSHTHYANPHGLDEPGHYSSASDLAVVTLYAMQNPVFRELVGTKSFELQGLYGLRTIDTSNKLLETYEGANGVKTGWTDDAGYCLVASADRDGVGLYGIVLGADSEAERFAEAAKLLDWGFEHYGMQDIVQVGASAAMVPVSDYLDVTVTAVVASSTTVPVFDLQGEITTSVDVLSEVDAPVTEGDRLGTLNVRQGELLLAQVPLIAEKDVEEPDGWTRFKIWVTRAWRTIFGGQRQAEPVSVM